MKIKLKKGKPASDESILALQAALGCQVSDSFRGFLHANDGAEPETNIFKITEKNESGVNRFIPVSEILKERGRIENIPAKAYPVAWAEGGNYVFVDEGKNGAVFFWDHELPEEPTRLAASFGAFLDLLEPFDIQKIELKPGQVKKVWVDPEFLKRLKK
jgi:hypothetical protein